MKTGKSDYLWAVATILVVMITGCLTYRHYRTAHPPYPPHLALPLKLAGSNQHELETALIHYTSNPADSLKQRAMEFLIANMSNKFSYYYDAPWNDIATVSLRWTSSSNKQLVLDTYKIGEKIIREDLKYITADYLINNIELAFKVWHEVPWGKDIPFDVFCEEILPYRVSTEPLEDWRAKALASFADVYAEFVKDSTMTAVKACKRLNDLLPTFRLDKNFPAMSFSQLMASTRGPCDNMANFGVLSMRALGIPVSFESTPFWPNLNHGHSWNAVRDSSGRYISFMGSEENPGTDHQGLTWGKSKVYRRTFAIQHGTPSNHDSCRIDVSAEYPSMINTEIAQRFDADSNVIAANLLAIGEGIAWNNVGFGMIENRKIKFGACGKSFLYLAAYDDNGQQPVNFPFTIRADSSVHLFVPDSSKMENVTFDRTTVTQTWLIERMKSCRFEGANKSDFSDSVLLYTIRDVPARGWNTVKIAQPTKFRYIRYFSKGWGNVAEVEFCGSDSVYHGKAIGTAGAWGDSKMTFDKAFDNDPTTFFDSPSDNGSWTGLDLGERRRINKIRFLPRDDGYLYPKVSYELFVWASAGWELLDRQKTSADLKFSCTVPSNALFYLKSTVTGEVSKPFYIENGEQKFF